MKILNDNIRLQVANLILDAQAITLSDTILASGASSPIYIDCRKLISYPIIREKITQIWSSSLIDITHINNANNINTMPDANDACNNAINDTNHAKGAQFIKHQMYFDHICGLESGGIPYASFLAQKMGISMLYARKTPKGHGKKRLLEGEYKQGQTVIIIDDVLSTGASKTQFIDNIKASNLEYAGCSTILYYNIFDIDDAIYPIHYLCNMHDIIHVAKLRKIFTADDILKIQNWLASIKKSKNNTCRQGEII